MQGLWDGIKTGTKLIKQIYELKQQVDDLSKSDGIAQKRNINEIDNNFNFKKWVNLQE